MNDTMEDQRECERPQCHKALKPRPGRGGRQKRFCTEKCATFVRDRRLRERNRDPVVRQIRELDRAIACYHKYYPGESDYLATLEARRAEAVERLEGRWEPPVPVSIPGTQTTPSDFGRALVCVICAKGMDAEGIRMTLGDGVQICARDHSDCDPAVVAKAWAQRSEERQAQKAGRHSPVDEEPKVVDPWVAEQLERLSTATRIVEEPALPADLARSGD